MDLTFITDFLSTLSGWMRPYLNEIGLSMMAMWLVVYGHNMTTAFQRQIGSLKFFLKITLFVVFCAFGFAFITSFATPFLTNVLRGVNDIWLPIIIIGAFYLIGFGAQKKGLI